MTSPPMANLAAGVDDDVLQQGLLPAKGRPAVALGLGLPRLDEDGRVTPPPPPPPRGCC
jgi:hypothetical protein